MLISYLLVEERNTSANVRGSSSVNVLITRWRRGLVLQLTSEAAVVLMS